MSQTPLSDSFLEAWLKKHKAPRDPAPKRPITHGNNTNPKWNDDAWFEKRYGDPDYYTRIKGLS